jgi:hypothetical protein
VTEPDGSSVRSNRKGQRRWGRLAAVAAAGLGAALLVAATFVPVNEGGRGGYVIKIYDPAATKDLQLFAVEPIGVAALVLAALVILLVAGGTTRLWVAGVLLAFGLQTGLLFLAYFGGAAFGKPEFNSLGVGSVLGLLGAALVAVAGAALLWQERRA